MNTIAMITLYYPEESVRKNIVQVSMLVDTVILLDNTPDYDNSTSFSDIKNVEYIALKRNCGLSEAYNYYLNTLKENCYIIFFDQDSYCPENLVGQLKTDYKVCCEKLNSKGLIGPAYFERNANCLMLPKQKKVVDKGLYKVNSIITSGMFTELEVMRRIGLWNEAVFLDMADWDVCWRAENAGMFCCLSGNAILTHSLGKGVHGFAGIKIKEGASFRIYYQIRDGLYLLGKDYVPLKFRIRFILMLTVRPVVHFLVLPDKKKRIHYFVKGIRDYRKKIHGALREEMK